MSEKKVDYNMSKYDYLYENNKKYMNYTALSFSPGQGKEIEISYEELHDKINKYATALSKYGIKAGDKVAVCAINTPESVYILYALDKIGAIVIGLSPLNNDYKMKQDLEMTMPDVVITIDMLYSKIKMHEEELGFSSLVYSPLESVNNPIVKFVYNSKQKKLGNYTKDKKKRLMNVIKLGDSDIFTYPKYKLDSLTDIMFTGGSTGVHKGVELSSRGLNAVVEGMEHMFKLEPGMVHLGQIPIGHMVYGRMIMHYSLAHNLEFAMTLKAMPNDFYSELLRTQPHAAVGGPPHWSEFVGVDENGNKIINPKLIKNSLPNLMYATSGGEAAKMENVLIENEALKYMGSKAQMGDGLGTTEMWSAVLINNGSNSVGSLGNPLSELKIKIVDQITGEEILDDRPGELHVSGPSLMLRYYNNEEETNKVIYNDENGTRWYNMGDIVKRTDKNFSEYVYVGRTKRNFVCGVDNIYPEEIESLLLKLPEIREVIVTRIPDDEKQYLPKYHISVFEYKFDTKELEDRINTLIISTIGESALPAFIEYTDKPLKRTDNTKLDVVHYQKLDLENLEKSKEKIKTRN